MRPLLYTYRRCPYAMRARMALLQASIEFDAYEIVLRDKPGEMLTISPKGTVPVLVLPDGLVIEESLDIMRWAFEGRDQEGWWQRADRPTSRALIALNDGPFKQQLDLYKYPERLEDTDRTFHRDQAVSCLLQPLEQRLAIEPYLGGHEPCAADLAIFPFVRQCSRSRLVRCTTLEGYSAMVAGLAAMRTVQSLHEEVAEWPVPAILKSPPQH